MKELKESLREIIVRAVENREIAGANVLVLKDGQEAAYAQGGFASIEKGIPYSPDTIARCYSMTKPVTATAAMILVDRGLLDLQAPVEEFLPGFRNARVVSGKNTIVPAKRPPCIHHLLNMTSGLSYGGEENQENARQTQALFEQGKACMDSESPLTTETFANRLGAIPLAFQPGDGWLYGASADVLGAVIQIVSGKKFGEFLREELFEPLGMEDAAFYVPAEKQGRLATVYQESRGELIPYRENHLCISNSMVSSPAFESGGAGLASTSADYGKLATMLLNGGAYEGRQYLTPRAVKYLTSGQLMPWQQEILSREWTGLSGFTYGNLMRHLTEPGKASMLGSAGEYGWDGWLGTYFSNSPADKLTMLVSLQKKDAGTLPVTRKLKNAIWSRLAD